ncbi:MAG TPA: lipid-A-disaccharide synthase [Syntrophales bacterium]|jgi:lipid-A-disaccharide synthase|nr:lipid-A-disaccharide synthase [Syntrophales bacterium]HOU78358.1 lipid-A-disaccharide synthase [Syntrophales bacterium]HPC33466.1 lipid-A-disaccharide synthase [Syntrophales bacterium]HQG34830.1 lipid-A-disaccharide synthase [Syntrophales bacterium]HQI36465.1 lipid-A-disaccharide synthase [Syntrophales bacterium]
MNDVAGKKVLIVAGEASGDLHGANLVRAMLALDPGLDFYGIGGPKMEAAGVRCLARAADMAVVGLTEVFAKLGLILETMGRLKRSLQEEEPALAILIDYPDFNMPLAKAAKKRGVKVFYYISPQVWAWRRGRIARLRELVDRMAVILPFEAEMYHREGVEAVFVGHPLLDAVQIKYERPEALRRFKLREGETIIGLLPGSRPSEVVKLLPEMLRAAVLIRRELPAAQFVLPIADTLDRHDVDEMVRPYDSELAVRIVGNEIYDVLAVCDAALVASGTATLEAALIGVPMIIVYKISFFTYLMGRLFVKVSHIGLANIIAGKTVVPELVQQDVNPPRLARELLAILTEEGRKDLIKQELAGIREKLGTPGASRRAARLAMEML